MSSGLSEQMSRGRRKWPVRLLIGVVVISFAFVVYIQNRPLVFNESFFGHAHCIAQAAGSLLQYAAEHQGRYPTHINGYGDALLLVVKDYLPGAYAFTGPGYGSSVFGEALASNRDVDEEKCGRVYVMGLSATSNPENAILFDKLPTPGGDHCHGLRRLTAPLCREALLVDGSHVTIHESKWQEFSQKQIEMLVREGFARAAASALCADKGKEH